MPTDKATRYVLLVLLAAGLFGTGVLYGRTLHRAVPSAPNLPAAPAAQEQEAGEVVVHVVGAVARPGVYRLPEGARVDDAVHLAGPLPEADLQALNLAAALRDGQRVAVPRLGENQAPARTESTGQAAAGSPSGGLVNINTATLAELDSLPGIGPALGQRIIDYREAHGPFRTVDDLLNVSGIGESRLEQLRPLVTVD